MTYIENVFVCIMSPLLVAALCMGRRQLRVFVFCFAGMGAAQYAAYILPVVILAVGRMSAHWPARQSE